MDATEALRIADQRMYAQKNAGRTSATRQSKAVLVRALSERNPELFTDLEGVAELAESTARRLGLGEEEAEQISHAAELHDIGKVAIPDAILSKPGTLDPREWEFIRRHTLIGERIIAAAPALGAVARLVRSSHERWDGTGYPDRLPGQQIPLGARVVGVADAFNAMTSERPYSPAVTPRARDHGAAPPRRHAVRPRRGRGVLRRPGRSSAPRRRSAESRLRADEDRDPARRRAAVGIAGLGDEPRLEAVARLHERAPEAIGEAEATLRVGPARCRSAPAAAHPGRARRSSRACPCEPARP